MFALDDDGFWFFSGYTGSSFSSYRKLAAGWAARDIVGVRDVSGDKVPDLLIRDNSNADRTLALRKGKPGADQYQRPDGHPGGLPEEGQFGAVKVQFQRPLQHDHDEADRPKQRENGA